MCVYIDIYGSSGDKEGSDKNKKILKNEIEQK